jgi:hypothetical protein
MGESAVEKENKERTLVSLCNYFKAVIFYALAKNHRNDKDTVSAIIAAYYCIFHLAVSRIKVFNGYVFDHNREMCNPSDPNISMIRHHRVQKLVLQMVDQKKLPASFHDLLCDLEKKRSYVNYGPRLWEAADGYKFDSCSYPAIKDNVPAVLKSLEREFVNYLRSLAEVNYEPYMFVVAYATFYFDEYQRTGWCSPQVLNAAKEFHAKLAKLYDELDSKVKDRAIGQLS